MFPDNLLYASDGQRRMSHSISVNHTYTFSAKWLNSLNVSYTTANPDRVTADDANVTLQNLGARVKNYPGANLLGVNINGWSGMSLGNVGYNYTRSFQIAESAGYATGRHNLRFGGEMRLYRSGFNSLFLTGGTATFSGQMLSDRGKQNAGNAYAEFVLGVAASWRQLSASRLAARSNLSSLFVQDDVRLTSSRVIGT